MESTFSFLKHHFMFSLFSLKITPLLRKALLFRYDFAILELQNQSLSDGMNFCFSSTSV